MRTIFFAFIALCFLNNNSFAQQKQENNFLKLKKKIITHLNILNAWANDYREGKTNLDPDSLAKITANELVKLLQFEEARNLDITEFNNTELSAKTDDSFHIRLYTFGYASGGTDGDINCQVIQWTNTKGKLFAYDFTKHFPYAFDEIYDLKMSTSACYLLMANRMFNPSEENCSALVIYFKGDYLFTNYSAFADTSSFELYNSEISFDPEEKILKIDFDFYDNENKRETSIPDDVTLYSDYKGDSLRKATFYKLMLDNYNEDENDIELKFDGTKFAGTIPTVPTFHRNNKEDLKQFLTRIKPDSSTLTDQFFEAKWDTTQKIIFAFYSKSIRSEVALKGHTNYFEYDFILGYALVPIGNNEYEQILIDTISSDDDPPKVLSAFFADADDDSVKELCVLISWNESTDEYSGIFYDTRIYEKPRFLNPPSHLDAMDDVTFSGCDCEYKDGRKTNAKFKTAAQVKLELKTRE